MQIEPGAIVEGKVTGVTDFGAFLSLPGDKTGMVHISEVAPTYVKEIRDYISESQILKVKVLDVNEDGKISLSVKQCDEQEPLKPTRQEQTDGRTAQPANRRNQRSNRRTSRPDVWRGPKQQASQDNMSFEDMMNQFKQTSDENLSDLKRANESKYSSGVARRSGGR